MDQKQTDNRWWEVATLLLAINSLVFGVLFGSGNQFGWAIVVGFFMSWIAEEAELLANLGEAVNLMSEGVRITNPV